MITTAAAVTATRDLRVTRFIFATLPDASRHLFEAAPIDQLFRQLLEMFDVILIDAPPALTEFAGLALVARVSGVLLVVEAERTRSPIVDQARRLIEASGGRILGVVLNKRRMYIPPLVYKWL